MIKFQPNLEGFDTVRTWPSTKALLLEKAERMAAEANSVPSTTLPAATEPYYEVNEAGDERRARYRVTTTSLRAYLHENKTFALHTAYSSG